MSVENSVVIIVTTCVALVIAVCLALYYIIQIFRELQQTVARVQQDVNEVAARLNPLIEHVDTTVQTINESVVNSVAIVKNSKQITKSVAYTLEAIQDVTHNLARRAQVNLRDEAKTEQADYTLQWTDIIMQCVGLIQKMRKEK